MSSILEALKKLEDEKAGRRSGAASIAAKVVKPGRRPGQRQKWLLPAGMTVVAVGAALFTYILMGGFSTQMNPVQPAPPTPLRQSQQATAPAAVPAEVTAAAPVVVPAPLPLLPQAIERKQSRPSSSSSPVTQQAQLSVAAAGAAQAGLVAPDSFGWKIHP